MTVALASEQTGTFTFYIKVEAQLGENTEIFWSEQKTFESKCGPDSTQIIAPEFPESFTFDIKSSGETPFFEIPAFTTA